MIGRADAKKKRFHIGINAMEYIINEIPECKMLIISEIKGMNNLMILIDNLNLKNNIIVNGYTLMPEIYFKNSSLNIFPSISEAFPMVICETKIFGIPNIMIGIDYITISEKGIEIIYDDSPEFLAIKSLAQFEYVRHEGIRLFGSTLENSRLLQAREFVYVHVFVLHGEKRIYS